jgi:SlyX protein
MTSQDHTDRITRLEMLISEQEYTIETLNTIVTQQANRVDSFESQVEWLKQQLKDLKQHLPASSPGHEKPPHY